MSHTIPLSLAMDRTGLSIKPMTATRAILICLIALFTTAIWGLILHFGSLALGAPIGMGWLAAALVAIFLVLLLGLSMAVVAADGPGGDELDPPPGA